MVSYAKKSLRSIAALTICLITAASLLAAPAFVAGLTDDSYTEVDYSAPLTLDTPVTGSTDGDAEFLLTEYGEFYLDSGYTVSLTADKTYLFTYTAAPKNQESDYFVLNLVILTGGTFHGYSDEYHGDCLAYWRFGFFDTTATIRVLFTPRTTGNYRVLTGCHLYGELEEIGVDTQLSVTEPITPDWEADITGESADADMFSTYTTSAPDGTVYTISNADPYSEAYYPFPGPYILFAFSPDGEMLWSYELPLASFTQPLVGADGTIYAATSCSIDETGTDPDSPFGSSYVVALNPDGSEKWVKEFDIGFEDDQPVLSRDFWGQMALSENGVLLLTAYNLYGEGEDWLVALDTGNDGEILWEIGDRMDCRFAISNAWSSPVIHEETVYIPIRTDACRGVAALGLSDGQELWRVETFDSDGVVTSNISVDLDGTIYLAGDGFVSIGGEELESPVYAIDWAGNVKWVQELGIREDRSFHTAVTDEYLYVGCSSGVYVLDKSSGEPVRQLSGENIAMISLTVLSDGSIAALYEHDDLGYYLNRISSAGDITEAAFILPPYSDNQPQPVVTKDGCYVVSLSGTMYCFDFGKTLAPGWTISGGNSARTNELSPKTVTFVSSGGSAAEKQTLFPGAMAVKPDNPTRASQAISATTTRIYTFDKWYIDEKCTEPYDFSAPVTADITLYAGWLYRDETKPSEQGQSGEASKPGASDKQDTLPPPPTGDTTGSILRLIWCIALCIFGGLAAVRPKKRSRCN